MEFFRTIGELWRGKTALRIAMHRGLRDFHISGTVIDIGGGRSPEYFKHFASIEGADVTPVDLSLPDEGGVTLDLETDTLPFAEQSSDTVLIFNLLEHIYNYRHVVAESYRIVKPGGSLIGFVPFLIQYHPDPHDYFRYTKESLRRILEEAGYRDVSVTAVGGGPFLANFNNIVLSMPRIIRVILYPVYAALDAVFCRFRPAARERYPLGYVFKGMRGK